MSKPNDGGPAYPSPGYDGGADVEECRTYPIPGMSLRDWLTGVAMQGLVRFVEDGGWGSPEEGRIENIAMTACSFADAVLVELAKEKP